MLTGIHQKLGTAGFIISIVALMAALGGGAYAASGGLTGKQTKEVEKIAKKYAGKPGAPGAAGPSGAAGAKGDTGAAGAHGTNGINGENGGKGDPGAPGAKGNPGASPTVVQLAPQSPPECEGVGGTKIIGAAGEEAFACNGTGGSGEGYPATLPSGRTETGLWESQGENGLVFAGVATRTEISFPLPLAAAPTETVLIEPNSTAGQKAECPGEFEHPEAATATAGILCLYTQVSTSLIQSGKFTFGAALFFPKADAVFGSWSVKAP
jgi:Collagen triple helix repeat (20 copies)